MKKKRTLIFISIALIAVFSVGVGVYLYLSSSKVIFSKAMEKAIDSLFESEEKGLLADLDYHTLKANTNTNLSLVSGVTNYSLSMNGNVGYNEENQKIYMDLNTNLNNKKLVDFQAMLENDKLYFKIKDLMTKFYYIDTQLDASQELKEDDLDHMVEILKDSFLDNLKDNDFDKSKQKLELSGKTISTTKLTLKLTEEKLSEMAIDFLNSVKSDKEAMKIIQKVYPDFTDETINEALDALKESKKDVDKNNYILYTIYVDKNRDIIKQEISINDATDKSMKDMSLVITSFKDNNKYQNLEFIILNSGVEVINLSLKEVSKEETKLVVNSALIKAEGTIKNNNTENSYNIVVTDVMGNKLGDIVYSLTKIDSNKFTYNFNMAFTIDDVKANLVSNNTILFDEQLTDFDLTNSQSIDKMSESEQNTIMNEISKRLSNIMQ